MMYADRSYPIQLQEMLGPDYLVLNFGSSGTGSMRSSVLSYWNSQEYKDGLNSNPDILIF